MTENRTSSYRQGTRCRICTGCGRCFGEKPINTVSNFSLKGTQKGSLPEDAGKASFACGNAEEKGHLVAVDIGTTTIAMQLRRLKDGQVMDSFTCINPQRSFGADVLSRIEAAENPMRKAQMKSAVQGALRQGLEQFTGGLSGEETIQGMAVAANTTMIHLLMGYDVSGLGQHPFTPQTLSEIRTSILGLDTVILPGISAFVGADIMAGIYALSMQEREELTLLLDLGTNGEMVLGSRERLLATSTAAGPAFEGGTDCYGADLMSLVARLLEEGLLDADGLLADPFFEQGIDIGGSHITQQYIRQLQLAKAAVCTGVRILCRRYGLTDFSRIDKVWLAGGMGYYLNPSAAAAIGLFPKELAERTVAVGNAALEGAFLYGRQAISEKTETSLPGTKEKEVRMFPQVEVFNLALEPGFEAEYIEAMKLYPA